MLNIGKIGRQAFGAVVCGAMLATAGIALSASPQSAPPKDLSTMYKLAPDWGTALPDGRPRAGSAAVDIDPDGVHVWAMDRCTFTGCKDSKVDPIMEFDAAGKVVKHFGAGLFVVPHGITVDKNGNIWVTDMAVDEATHRGAQVFK